MFQFLFKRADSLVDTCVAAMDCRTSSAAALEAVVMGKSRIKPNYRRRSLRLPDLDHYRRAVLNSLNSQASRRVYEYAIDQFIAWYCSEPRLAFNRIGVMRYRLYLESRHLAANTKQSGRQTRSRSLRTRGSWSVTWPRVVRRSTPDTDFVHLN